MKTTKVKIAGTTLIVSAVLVAAVVQLSGHGYSRVVTHPGPTQQETANGITVGKVVYTHYSAGKVIHTHYSLTQLSMLAPVLVGTMLLLFPRRGHAA